MIKKLFRFGKSKKDSEQEDSKEKVPPRRQTISGGKAEFVEAHNRAKLTDYDQARYRTKPNGIATVLEDDNQRGNVWNAVDESPRYGAVPGQHVGEQVAAGWPAWLTAVAGEALKGWLPRRADAFEKIDKIGQGTYSNVYKARDLETGKIVALKKVRFDNLEPESVRFMAREIKILRRLDHPNVVKLEGLVTSRMSCSLYLVFEYMDHDLAGIAGSPNITFTEAQVKCYLLQILKGLEHCHKSGVLHRDIKGSNLLIDSRGNLKIADFGLATFFQPDKRQQLTTRVVTLWYRPPELLLGATEYGVAIDLWSVGCILGELFAGRPILPGRTEVEQLHKIFKLCGSPSEEYWKKYKLSHATLFKPQHPYKRNLTETYKNFPQTALDLLDVLLAIEPDARGSASSALKSRFFSTEPFACDPSSLPKYIPKDSTRGTDNRARRQRAPASRTREMTAVRKDESQESLSKPAAPQRGNPDIAPYNQKQIISAPNGARSKSERFIAQKKEVALKLPADVMAPHEGPKSRVHALPPKPVQPDAQENLNWAGIWDKTRKEQNIDIVKGHPMSRSVRYATISDFNSQAPVANPRAANLSKWSTLVATRNNGSQEFQTDSSDARSKERARERKKTSNLQQLEVTEISQQNQSMKRLDIIDVQDAMNHERDKNTGFRGPAARIHFSGPLLPPSANLDRMLNEHERQVQNAVRRARQEKGKIQNRAETQINGVKAAGGNFRDNYGPAANSRVKSSRFSEHTKNLDDSESLDSLLENYEHEMRHL